MITTLLTSLVLASAPGQGICVKSGEIAGVTRAWYRNAEPITLDGKRYVKYGLPRQVPAAELELVGTIDGVPAMAERGVAAHEVLYLLADASDCSVQPYQVAPK